MSSYHIPDRLESQDTQKSKACFIPSGVRSTNSNMKGSREILETFDFRVVGQVVADSQLLGACAQQTNVINYTEDYIVVLDKWNRISVIPPVPEGDLGRGRYDGAILIEIVNSKAQQSADIGSRAYRRYRNVALLQKGDIGGYFYKEPNREEAPKWQGNQIHQFSISDASNQLVEAGGSVYCPNSDLVFMTLDAAESGEIVLHPNTDVATLAALDLEEDVGRVITHQISVNNMKSSSAYVNIGGDVVTVPNTRDPNMKTGITIRRLENRRGTKMKLISDMFYEFDDPACPLNVFDSENAAITQGSPDKLVDLEIAKTKLLTEHQKAVNAKANQDYVNQKTENDKQLEEKRKQDEMRQAELNRARAEAAAKAEQAKAEAEREKAEQAKKENIHSHRSRMLEIGGKIVLAVAGIITATLSIYKLKKS